MALMVFECICHKRCFVTHNAMCIYCRVNVMKTLSVAIKSPADIKVLRKTLKLQQTAFWGRIGVTQSGGSRYEAGRDIPEPTLILLNIVYGSKEQSEKLVEELRSNKF